MNPFSVKDIEALDGRVFAMLSEEEYRVFKFFRDRGQKYGVCVTIAHDVAPSLLASARSQQETDDILRKTNSTVAVQALLW